MREYGSSGKRESKSAGNDPEPLEVASDDPKAPAVPGVDA